MTAGATSAGIARSSMMVMSGITTTPPLKAAIGPRISSGWTSMRMPRGGRPLVMANSTPISCSRSIASIARGVTTLALLTRVPSTSAKTAATVPVAGTPVSVMSLALPSGRKPGAVRAGPHCPASRYQQNNIPMLTKVVLR